MSELDKNETEYKQTTVEVGTQFKGTLQSASQVIVRGVVDGDLIAPSLIIAETGTVVGNIKVQTIHSAGVLAGRVDADDIHLSGSVRSDTVIRAKNMEVKLQNGTQRYEVTFGECRLEIGDEPSGDEKLSEPAPAREASAVPTTSTTTTAAAAPAAAIAAPAPTSSKRSARRAEAAASAESVESSKAEETRSGSPAT